MNIHDAKGIPIAEILRLLNISPRQQGRGQKLLYSSPIRTEKTPSFWVYQKTNRWYDYGIGQGGDTIDLVCAWLRAGKEDHATADALRWLTNMTAGHYLAPVVYEQPQREPTPAALTLRRTRTLQSLGLIHYLQKRGIPLAIADQQLAEVHVRNGKTGKRFIALGLANEEGGYELRNPFFKGTLGPKSLSFVRGRTPKPDAIHLFEGMFDYLTALTERNGQGFAGDVIVLNSLVCLKQAFSYMQGYGYQMAYTWLDNDAAGHTATTAVAAFCQTQNELTHQPMNARYAPHKDVSTWRMHRLGL